MSFCPGDFAAYEARSTPTNTTGPVGEPVGEPPGGSTLMARVAPALTSGGNAASWNFPSAGMTPSGRGFAEAFVIAHSS